MKKLVCWLMMAAASVTFAENAATYHALSWSVPGAAINAFDARYVNVYAEDADGNRLPGGDGRDGQITADVNLTTTSIVQGDEGWGLTPEQIQGAKFRVELLGASMGAVAVSDPVDYADLVEADAFAINYESSGVPVNGDTPYLFPADSFKVTAADGGVYNALKSIFGANAEIVPEVDAAGNYVNYTVKLLADLTGPIQLGDDLGKVTIDLNGHEITGKPAANGSGEQGGNAIEIVAGTLDPGAGVTKLVVMNSRPASDYTDGCIVGGKGADAATGKQGGYAIAVISGAEGVTVDVKSGTVKGGASGNSAGVTPTLGIAAISGAELIGGSVLAGDAGTSHDYWAWTKTSYEAGDVTPPGTTLDADGKLYIWRVSMPDVYDFAKFNFDEIAEKMTDGKVYFVDGEISVAQIKATAAAGDLTFIGGEDTVLVESAAGSAFDIKSSATQVRSWTNLTFTADVGTAEYGGAICVDGGAIDVSCCTFTNCVASDLGGAILAEHLTATSRVVQSVFVDNAARGANGSGGALCVAAAQSDAEVVFSIVDTTFERNSAGEMGGAICNVAKAGDLFDQDDVTLDIVNSTFEDNSAVWQGGAICSEGDVNVDSLATVNNRGTTLFARNTAGWSGGAISINGIGTVADTVDVRLGRGVVFAGNVVSNVNDYVEGGAIDVYLDNSTFVAEGVAFIENAAYGEGKRGTDVYGGAFYIYGGTAEFDTCIFDANEVHGVATAGVGLEYYGAGVYGDATGLSLRNCTFRNQNVEAVYAWEGTVGVTNCVIVGNAADPDDPKLAAYSDDKADVIFDGSSVSMAYSATGVIAPYEYVSVANENNLANRTTEIYADSVELDAPGTLRLRETGFNPVAALGIEQSAYDFDGVLYGSKKMGFSMGAFETSTEPVVVNIDADKIYNGNNSSNGIDWAEATWALTRTNGEAIAWSDLVPTGVTLPAVLTITDWWYGTKNAGDYASSNAAPANINATVEGAGEKKAEIDMWIAREVIQFAYTGTIERRNIDLGGLEVVVNPDEYKYTGDNVWATVVVTDTLPEGGEVLAKDNSDYTLLCTDNVEPTAEANAEITLLRNFVGVTNVNYWITAYLVEYKYDGVIDESQTLTIGELSGTNVNAGAIAEIDTKGGVKYVFDKYYSTTNGTVRKVDATGGILRLEVLYCADRNDDGVPDKYQREILAKVVNGTWNGAQEGRDPKVWVTLWKDGKWSTTGEGSLTAFPAEAGANAMGGFSAGGWLAFNADGSLYQVETPANFTIKNTTVPFLVYAYRHGDASTGGRTRGGHAGTHGGDVAATTAKSLVEQYTPGVKIVQYSVTNGGVTLKANAMINDVESGASVLDETITNADIKLWAVEKLGQPWEKIEKAHADGNGNVVISTEGLSSCFFKVGL